MEEADKNNEKGKTKNNNLKKKRLNGNLSQANVFSSFWSHKHLVNREKDLKSMIGVPITINDRRGRKIKVTRIKKAIAALRSIYSTLYTNSLISPYEEDNYNKLPANNINGKIEFRNVYFAYPSNPEHVVLKNISFKIMPGEKVALVGYSGCGKSSVIQLLNRFYDVEDGKGEILIDDINIKEYNLYELRKKIGFVPQEPTVFKTSNLENIRYGNLNSTDDECIEAAKEANASKILEKEKNDEFIGDKNKKGKNKKEINDNLTTDTLKSNNHKRNGGGKKKIKIIIILFSKK